jgi:hypothetical protein
MKLSEAAERVIDLAGKIREYYEAELPKRHRNYPLIEADEEGPPPPPEEKELRQFLSAVPEDTIRRLMLIMHLGRGDIGAEDLPEHYEALKAAFGDPRDPASQLMDNVPLADYLSDGLEELRKRRIDVDKLPLRKVAARKR